MIARAMPGRTLLLALCVLCWSAFPVQPSDESPANRLFVEAARLIQAAEEEAGAARKLELLKRARHKLERIVDSHPSSGLAVKLISGQKIGTVSLAGLDDEIEAAIEAMVVHACPQAPTFDCVFSMAVVTARTIEDAATRAWTFTEIAVAQARKGDVKQAGETFGIALETAKALEDAGSRAWAFAEIAVAQARKGDGKQAGGTLSIALETAKTIEGAGSRAWAFAEIAVAQATKGDGKQARKNFGIALETARELDDADSRAEAFTQIARALAESG